MEGVIITVIRSTTAEYILHPTILRQRETYCEASFSVVQEVYLHDMQLCQTFLKLTWLFVGRLGQFQPWLIGKKKHEIIDIDVTICTRVKQSSSVACVM